MRGFNFLPVYYVKAWEKEQLKALAVMIKSILDLSFEDTTLRLYGFQENTGYDSSLFNNVLFIDRDGSIYFSDIVSTFSGVEMKTSLFLGHIDSLSLQTLK